MLRKNRVIKYYFYRTFHVILLQVKVPDPAIVKELEIVQIELTTTKTEVINLQQDISKLQNELMQKEAEIAKQVHPSSLNLSQATNFRFFQTERACRQQFHI